MDSRMKTGGSSLKPADPSIYQFYWLGNEMRSDITECYFIKLCLWIFAQQVIVSWQEFDAINFFTIWHTLQPGKNGISQKLHIPQ